MFDNSGNIASTSPILIVDNNFPTTTIIWQQKWSGHRKTITRWLDTTIVQIHFDSIGTSTRNHLFYRKIDIKTINSVDY